MKKLIKFLTTKAGFFLLAALLWSTVMYSINFQQGITWKDIWVEADGMFFDLIVFGVVLSVYEAFSQKKERIEDSVNLIEDLRGWENEEGVRRTAGAIRRLNKEGKTDIELFMCYLKKAWLEDANLRSADLRGAWLEDANLIRADLRGAWLGGVNLKSANLRNADLREANLRVAHVEGADLEGASVENDWFEKLKKWEVVGWEKIIEEYIINEQGRLQSRQNNDSQLTW